jgi:hypothetical protein
MDFKYAPAKGRIFLFLVLPIDSSPDDEKALA